MENKRINQTLKCAVLLVILLLAVTITPTIIFGQTNSTSTAINVREVAERITDRYLIILAYNSSEKPQYSERTSDQIIWGEGTYNAMHNGIETIVNLNYVFRLESGISEGYVYRATFQSSDGKEYNVEESNHQTTQSGIVTTTVNQKITGSMTYSLSITEDKTTTGSVVNTNRAVNIHYENSSGTFFYNAKADGTWNSNMTTLLKLTATIDQNSVAPFGHYTLIAFIDVNGQTKINMTMPDGTVVDPGIYLYANEYGGLGEHLSGWMFWATEAEYWLMNFALWLVNVVFLVFPPTFLIGLTVVILEGLGLTGDLFMADMDGTGVVVFYVLVIDCFGTPYFTEAGYYTNRIAWQPLDNWYFCPLFSAPFVDHTGWNWVHAGLWPIIF
jgi:hypothetical protein